MDIKKFLDIEQKYRLYELSAAGVCYWVYARFTIWNYMICSSGLRLSDPHKKKKYTVAQKTRLVAGLVLHSTWKRKIDMEHTDILFLCHERRVKSGRYYECIYTERLSEQYKNSITLEKPYEYRHFKPVRNQRVLYVDDIVVKGNLYAMIHKLVNTKKYRKLMQEVKEQMAAPLAEFRKAYLFETQDDTIYELLVQKIMLYQKEYKEYEKLFCRIHPKVVVEVVYYCLQNMIINEIAKKYSVPTIELQHGTIYAEHAAYQYAGHSRVKQLPDRMFLFSDFWKKQLHVPLTADSIIAAGYPLFEEKVREYKKQAKKKEKKVILFVSQGTVGTYLGRLAFEMAKYLPSEKFRIIYKLHPAEYQTWKEDYAYLQSCRVEVAGQGAKNIYDYFAISDVQIGVYSTAIYEGLGFELQTLVLKVGHYSVMQPLVDEGFARYIDSAEQAVQYIKENKWGKMKKQDFWKENSLQTMMDEIGLAGEGTGK